MKSRAEIRMHCLSLANALSTAKQIGPTGVIAQAQKYLDWIEERHEGDNDRRNDHSASR